MQTRLREVLNIAGMAAALFLLTLVPVSKAQAQDYSQYRVDGQELTDREKYILGQVKDGKDADVMGQFVLPLIPDKDRREQAQKLGLTDYLDYLEKLNKEDREEFLKSYGPKLRIRAGFLRKLLTGDFPDFHIHPHGVRIYNVLLEEPLNLEGTEVDQIFALLNSILQGGAVFRDSCFKKLLLFNKVNFAGKADFHRVRVAKNLVIQGSTFQGPVNFAGADIERQFNAKEAKFLNEEETAQLYGLKVGKIASFEGAVFKGPVDLSGADIGQAFNANKAKFLKENEKIKLHDMKVGQAGFFYNVIFEGPVDLRYSNIQGLEFVKVKCPKVDLEGVTYNYIYAGEDWRKLLQLLKKAPYHSQPYRQMETFLKQTGYPERGDEVFISGKRRAWKLYWDWKKPWQWPGKILEKILLDWGVGYGRHPGRIIYYSVFFIFLGTVIFLQPAVLTWEGGEAEKQIRLKQAFWFSLDAYLPFVSLGPDKFYQLNRDTLISLASFIPKGLTSRFPKGLQDWLTNRHLAGTTYFYLHQLAGYVLVSIGIAAVTGIVK